MTKLVIKHLIKGELPHGKTDWDALRKMKEPIIDEECPEITMADVLRAKAEKRAKQGRR